MNKGFSSILNASRWIAALLVLVGHVRHLVFADLKDVAQPNLIDKAFYFFTGLASEAVTIFFVVSGLLVGGLTLEKFRIGASLGLKDYFIHRFSRIYIVYIPTLLIGVVIYHMVTYFQLSGEVSGHTDILTLLGNLAMLQNITVDVFGNNHPLWSLAYEWWFYCIWAFAIGILFYSGLTRYISLFLLALLLVFLPNSIYLSLPVWLLGVATFYYARSNLPKPHPVFGVGIFLVVLVVSRLSHNVYNVVAQEPAYIQFARASGLGVVYLLALASCYRLETPLWLDRLNEKLASFSYSLYLIHYPLMFLVVALVEKYLDIKSFQQPSLMAYLYFAVVSIILYLFSYLFSLITEKHTYKLIKLLRLIILKPSN